MTVQRLIKKILDQAKIFKSRANRSPEDMKRHDLIQPDEQRMMRVAYKELGWSYTKIGSIFDRDPRAVAKKVVEFSQVKSEHSRQDDSPSLGTNAMSVSTTAQEKFSTCQAPPANIDVAMLKEWKVPPKKAPPILNEWLFNHKKGSHDVCVLYKNFVDDLNIRKIPINQALAILVMELRDKEHNLKSGQQDAELIRKYRPWESRENRDAFMKAMGLFHSPSEDMKKHLTEIAVLLNNFIEEVNAVIYEQQWDVTFEIEQNVLFDDMMSHCCEVRWEFIRFSQERGRYESVMRELVFRITQEIPIEAEEPFAESIALCAMYRALRYGLPEYRIGTFNDTNWRLSILENNNAIDVATGDKGLLGLCQKKHTELIEKYRQDLQIKELLNLRKKMLGYLKSLQQQIRYALIKQTYTHNTFCLKCPLS